jgi:hypothetical protein
MTAAAAVEKPVEKGIPNSLMIADAAFVQAQNRHSAWSVDELLCHPKEMLTICRAVRRQFPQASDYEICKSLLNARKRGHTPATPSGNGRKERKDRKGSKAS